MTINKLINYWSLYGTTGTFQQLYEEYKMCNTCKPENNKNVDLSTLKPGQIVKLRCGGEFELKDNASRSGDWIDLIFKMGDKNFHNSWNKDGSFTVSLGHHPLDIVEIIPLPFDWADVKPGMAFLQYPNKVVWYVGPDYANPLWVVVNEKRNHVGQSSLWSLLKNDLVRKPEDDIKVPS